LRVEVVYALAGVQDVVVLELDQGAVAGAAVAASGLLQLHGLPSAHLKLGISGRRACPESPLHDGDRVEILRPLAMGPGEARRLRARKSRV
jgi:putative ubiquitin-RnfH superfamily antitoxin RatB of RatAB toxin-antitoxin module